MTLHNIPLYSNNILYNSTDRIQRSNTALETISKKMAKCLPNKSMHLTQNREAVSPWGLYCVYRAAVVCVQQVRETRDSGAVENLLLLKQTLSTIRTRWNVAGTRHKLFAKVILAHDLPGVYLQLLEVHEVVGNA
jgi:hypothetical protein